jgi:hypothetical protein
MREPVTITVSRSSTLAPLVWAKPGEAVTTAALAKTASRTAQGTLFRVEVIGCSPSDEWETLESGR